MKSSIEQAFRDCLVPSLRLGMPIGGCSAAYLKSGRAASIAFPGGTWKRD
ncbi:hypothetical protein [Scytonema sp. PRP1]